MGRRGRKPKETTETPVTTTSPVVKKRGRRSKKQPTVCDIISLDASIDLSTAKH